MSSSASGSRKHSGNEEEKERSGLGYAGGRRRRFKDPLRRAFTLPTMLSNTFALVPQSVPKFPASCSTFGRTEDEQQEQLSEDKCPLVAGRFTQPPRVEPGNRSRIGTTNRLGVTNDNNRDLCSPLSCLVTPIRRANPSAAAISTIGSKQVVSQESSLGLPVGTFTTSASSATFSGTAVTADSTELTRPPEYRTGGEQIMCPIWARAMAQLDARQGQPRDQSQFAHLLGPPSSLGYLVATTCELALGTADGTNSSSKEESANCGELRVRVRRASASISDSPDSSGLSSEEDYEEREARETSIKNRNRQRRSSNESVANRRRSKLEQENRLYLLERKATFRLGEDKSISKVNDASLRLENVVATVAASKHGQSNGPSPEAEVEEEEEEDKKSWERTQRIKRFSSASCLADQQQGKQKRAESISPSGRRKEVYGGKEKQQQVDKSKEMRHGKQVASKAKRTQKEDSLRVVAADPVALDRQRRPSVSNQGSVNVDQQALFSAIECCQLERAKAILEEGKVNVNSLNGDKLTCLDIAVLMRNVDMVKLLQQHGAKESSAYLSREGRANQLYALYMEARQLVEDLSRSLQAIAPNSSSFISGTGCCQQPSSVHRVSEPSAQATNGQSNGQLMLATGSLLSSALFEEKQRQLQYWRRRLDLFMHMRYEFEQLQIPNVPELIVLQVVGETSLGVKIVHSPRPQITRQPVVVQQQQQQQQQQLNLDAVSENSQTMRCSKGTKCSHWLLGGNQEPAQQVSIGKRQSQLIDYSDSLEKMRQPAARDQVDLEEKNGQKLAAFNQLLAQQLMVLSYQQQRLIDQQIALDGTNKDNFNSSRLMLRTQNNSTDSACDSLSSRQSAKLDNAELEPCPSIAYQLMSGHLIKERAQRQTARHQANRRRASRAAEQQIGETIVTKYKVEWSRNADMEPNSNSMIVYNTNACPLECQINGLTSGHIYYVRVSAGNHKGFSEARFTAPAYLSPSSWRQVEDHRQVGGLQSTSASSGGKSTSGQAVSKSSLINMLLLDATTPSSEELKRESRLAGGQNKQVSLQQQQQQQTSSGVRKNLKNFFQSSSCKFHKLNNQNKRGLYLVAAIYHSSNQDPTTGDTSNQLIGSGNDKIVVTNDDRLPVIEIINDLVSPAALMSDFYWLLKISGTHWMDIKRIRQQLQKSHSSSTLHLRIKLLSAIELMQLALNMEDIGRLFHRPIQAHDGSLLICTCRQVVNTKLVSNLSIKWTHQHKIIPRHLRKISDSMMSSNTNLANQPTSTTSSSNPTVQINRRATEMIPDSLGSNTNNDLNNQQQVTSCGSTGVALSLFASSSVAALTGSSNRASDTAQNLDQRQFQWNSGNAGENRLCEHCQHGLIQRRCTTTSSNSSGFSLSSSNESQWSSSGNPSPRQCTCSRSNSGVPSSACSLFPTPSSIGTNQPQQQQQQQQRASSSTTGSSNVRSSSLAVGSQAVRANSSSNQLSVAQRSSPYLMLASLSLYDLLLFSLNEIIHFDRTSNVPVRRGLYLGFVQLQTTVESMRLLVPRAQPNMVPCSRIRDNAHVSKEEWQLLKKFATFGSSDTTTKSNNQQSRSRASDPSIWSFGGGIVSMGETTNSGEIQIDTSEGTDHPSTVQPASGRLEKEAIEANKSLGFDRSRAKSVSPALIKEFSLRKSIVDYGGSNEMQSHLSASNEQLRSAIQQRQLVTDYANSGSSSSLQPTQIPSCSKMVDRTSDIDIVGQTSSISASETSLSSSMVSSEQRQLLSADGQSANCSDDNHNNQHSSSTQKGRNYSCTNEQQLSNRLQAQQPQQQQTSNDLRTPLNGSRLTLNSLTSLTNISPEETFVRLVGSAARRLLAELKARLPKGFDEQKGEWLSVLQSLNDNENNRIYHVELIELSSQISFILLIPSAENVCPVTSHEKSNILADNKDYMLLPLQIFETIHIGTYEPDLLGKYSRLSAILETDLTVALHDHRQAFSSNEIKSTKSRVNSLQDMVSIADEFWRQLRWIVDVVSFARDKSTSSIDGAIRLETIWRYFDLTPSTSYDHSMSWLASNYNQTRWQQQPENVNSNVTNCKQQVSNLLREQVKRTTSAKARGECNRQQEASNSSKSSCFSVIENVPEIHLTQSSGVYKNLVGGHLSSVKQSSRKSDCSTIKNAGGVKGSRRHSGDAIGVSSKEESSELTGSNSTSSNNRETKVKGGHKIRCTMITDGDICINTIREPTEAAVAINDGDSDIFDLDLKWRENSDDEEAIYAYHISLKDATRAAAQRKSSQQSVRAFVCCEDSETEGPRTPIVCNETTFIPNSKCIELDKEKTGANSLLMSRSSDARQSAGADTLDDVASFQFGSSLYNADGDEDKLEPQLEATCSLLTSDSTIHSKGTNRTNLKQMKTTNPFLSDSFDMSNK